MFVAVGRAGGSTLRKDMRISFLSVLPPHSSTWDTDECTTHENASLSAGIQWSHSSFTHIHFYNNMWRQEYVRTDVTYYSFRVMFHRDRLTYQHRLCCMWRYAVLDFSGEDVLQTLQRLSFSLSKEIYTHLYLTAVPHLKKHLRMSNC